MSTGQNSPEPNPAPTGGQGLTSRRARRTPKPPASAGGRRPKASSTEITENILGQLQALVQAAKYVDQEELDLPNKPRTTCEFYAALNELRRFVHRIEGTE